MNDTRGFYQKYNVTRTDGRPIEGRTFTIEMGHDPFASRVLRLYAFLARDAGYEALADDLVVMCDELDAT